MIDANKKLQFSQKKRAMGRPVFSRGLTLKRSSACCLIRTQAEARIGPSSRKRQAIPTFPAFQRQHPRLLILSLHVHPPHVQLIVFHSPPRYEEASFSGREFRGRNGSLT